jgi:hypothetical protein
MVGLRWGRGGEHLRLVVLLIWQALAPVKRQMPGRVERGSEFLIRDKDGRVSAFRMFLERPLSKSPRTETEKSFLVLFFKKELCLA